MVTSSARAPDVFLLPVAKPMMIAFSTTVYDRARASSVCVCAFVCMCMCLCKCLLERVYVHSKKMSWAYAAVRPATASAQDVSAYTFSLPPRWPKRPQVLTADSHDLTHSYLCTLSGKSYLIHQPTPCETFWSAGQ